MAGELWVKDYEPLKYDTDEEHDFYDDVMSRGALYDSEMREAAMSSAWSRGRKKADNSEAVVHDLIAIRGTVHNLLKIHGMPSNTTVDIAMLGQMGKGVSGYKDDGGNKPFICLDKSVYDQCDSKDMLDVYCGIGLHEASHLNHSHLMFKRLQSGELVAGEKRAMWEGLFEDERIEQKVREESPGYAPYVQATKRALFEKKEFGLALDSWDSVADLDKVSLLIFAFIRCPHLITNEMRHWKTVKGECLFDTLRSLFPYIPEDEEEIAGFGEKLMDMWDRLRAEYDVITKKTSEEVAEMMSDSRSDSGSATDCTGGSDGDADASESDTGMESDSGEAGDKGETGKEDSGSGDSEDTEESEGDAKSEETDAGEDDPGPTKEELIEAHKRLLSQKKADREDSGYESMLEDMRKSVDRAIIDMSSLSDTADATDMVEDSRGEGKVIAAEKRKDKLDKVRHKKDEDRKGRRFSVIDMMKMLERMETITDPLDVSESKEMAKATEDRLEMGDAWEAPVDDSHGWARTELEHKDRRTIIIHPKVTEQARKTYKQGLNLVRGHVNRMRNVFRLRLGTHHYRETELVEGRLHRRQIGKAMVTDRLFHRHYTKLDQGISLCLLLDESGSMGSVSHHSMSGRGGRAETALTVAILIAESLKAVPGVELEVYSYASCGVHDKDCLIKYLYGAKQPHIESIAAYGRGNQNYDHMALKTAGDLFVDNTTNPNRLMIVLSDGAPSGYGYGGPYANAATKKAVETLEKRGIYVLNVAIEAYASETMFKHVLKFLDLSNLVSQMRRLVTRIIKNATT